MTSPASSGGHVSSVVLTMSTTVLTGPPIACRTSPPEITTVFGKPLTRSRPRISACGSAGDGQADPIAGPVSTVVDIVKTTLDKCPPELAGDVMDRGIALTGGGALLRGLDERLRDETGMPIQLAGNPLESVVLGAGKCVEDFDALQQVLVPERRR